MSERTEALANEAIQRYEASTTTWLETYQRKEEIDQEVEDRKLDTEVMATEQSPTATGVAPLKKRMLAEDPNYQGALQKQKMYKYDLLRAEHAMDVAKMQAWLRINLAKHE